MKSIGNLVAIGIMILASCKRHEENAIRPMAVRDVAAVAATAEKKRFLSESLEKALKDAAAKRDAVSAAKSPQEIALAAEDLRVANDDVRELRKKLEEVR